MAMYDGLRDAQSAITTPMTVFKKKFVPKPDKSFEIFLNVASVAVGFASPALFNSCKLVFTFNRFYADYLIIVLKPAMMASSTLGKIASEERVDKFNDVVGKGFAAGFQKAKDLNKDMAAKELTDVKEKIDYIFSATVSIWKESLTVTNNAIFNGNGESLDMLNKLLQNGISADGSPGQALHFQKSTTKFLFSTILPDIWRMQGYHPVLLDSGWDCNTKGIGVRQWTKRKDVMDLMICSDDRQYQLWGLKGDMTCQVSNNPCFTTKVCENYLTELPGLGYIKEERDEFGGMSVYTMTARQVLPNSYFEL
jgi:hypothetical protein